MGDLAGEENQLIYFHLLAAGGGPLPRHQQVTADWLGIRRASVPRTIDWLPGGRRQLTSWIVGLFSVRGTLGSGAHVDVGAEATAAAQTGNPAAVPIG